MRPRFNKYGAKRAHCSAAHEHASKKEAARCNELRLLERAGQITHLEIEPQFWFVINGEQAKHANGRRVGFKPDFAYREDGKQIAEDVKGGKATRTEAQVLRVTLFRHIFRDVELREI